MKKTTMLLMLLSTQLFSNYSFNNDNTVKIDMHGGKNEKLTDNTNKFSEMKINDFKGLQNISIKKPKESNDLNEKQNLELEDIRMNK